MELRLNNVEQRHSLNTGFNKWKIKGECCSSSSKQASHADGMHYLAPRTPETKANTVDDLQECHNVSMMHVLHSVNMHFTISLHAPEAILTNSQCYYNCTHHIWCQLIFFSPLIFRFRQVVWIHCLCMETFTITYFCLIGLTFPVSQTCTTEQIQQ